MTARQLLGRAHAPVVEKQDTRLLAGHVLMDGDDQDAGLAKSLEHRLELRLDHGEVAVHDRLVVRAGERRPLC